MFNKDILIIGESCRDIFIYCDSTRLCPDRPVPVLKVLKQTENYGMAKNVECNILALEQSCDIVTNPGWENITKTRYIHDETNHMFIRVDTDHTISRIKLNDSFKEYKMVIVSDYNKGFLHENDIEYICNNHNNVFIDTKKQLGNWANRARFIKINNYEYERSKEHLTPLLTKKIIRTKGGEGCIYNNKIFPVDAIEVRDTSGCGDTFLSGLAVNYLNTNDIEQSIVFANRCASEVAKHKGVTIANSNS